MFKCLMSVRSTLQAKQIKPSEWVGDGKMQKIEKTIFCDDESFLHGVLK